jgi:outer membrane protein assembly factor BamD
VVSSPVMVAELATRLQLIALAVALPLALGACAASNENQPGVTEPNAGAEELYRQAMEDLADGLYPEALAGFTDVKTKFPYSSYAPLADLRTADTHYERGKFIEAIDAYRQFLKLHPGHAEAPYAMFRVGESYFEQLPGEWWFLPPPAEKDQANTRLAIAAYRDMIERFPKSEHATTAGDKLEQCRRKLADHEMYVAQFYAKREKWLATAGRAEGLLRDYPGLGLDAEALWLAAHSRFELGELDRAKAHAQRLMTQYPDSSQAGLAGSLLEELGGS